MSDEIWHESVQNHSHWAYQAKINQEVADFVYEKFKDSVDHHGMIMMLYGLSLECYLKFNMLKLGYIPVDVLPNSMGSIEKDIDENNIKSKLKLKEEFTKHNLQFFYKYCMGKIDDKVKNYLEKLERAVKSGKYPFEKMHNPINLFFSCLS